MCWSGAKCGCFGNRAALLLLLAYFLLIFYMSMILSGCGSVNYHADFQQGSEPEHSITWDVELVDFSRVWKKILFGGW
jgi:hypothetical protein